MRSVVRDGKLTVRYRVSLSVPDIGAVVLDKSRWIIMFDIINNDDNIKNGSNVITNTIHITITIVDNYNVNLQWIFF